MAYKVKQSRLYCKPVHPAPLAQAKADIYESDFGCTHCVLCTFLIDGLCHVCNTRFY